MSAAEDSGGPGIDGLDTLRVIAHDYKFPPEILVLLRWQGTPGVIRFRPEMLVNNSPNPVNWRLKKEFHGITEFDREDWNWLRGVWETRMEVYG